MFCCLLLTSAQAEVLLLLKLRQGVTFMFGDGKKIFARDFAERCGNGMKVEPMEVREIS